MDESDNNTSPSPRLPSSWGTVDFDLYNDPLKYHVTEVLGTISLVFGVFGMYLAAMKSPKIFGPYKYFIFNICFSLSLTDIYMVIFFRPKLLFPAMVICPTGLLKTDDDCVGYVAYMVFIILHSSTGIAILSAFLYRFAALKNNISHFLSKKVLAALGVLQFTYSTPLLTAYALSTTNRPAVNAAILRDWPEIYSHYGNDGKGCAAIHTDVTLYSKVFLVLVTLTSIVIMPLMFVLITNIFHTLHRRRHRMSSRTYRLHRQLLVTLVFQFAIPCATLFVPFGFISAVMMFQADVVVEYTGIASFLIIYFHSPLNTISMIYFIPHYRRTVWKWFCVVKNKNDSTTEESQSQSIKRSSLLANTTLISH